MLCNLPLFQCFNVFMTCAYANPDHCDWFSYADLVIVLHRRVLMYVRMYTLMYSVLMYVQCSHVRMYTLMYSVLMYVQCSHVRMYTHMYNVLMYVCSPSCTMFLCTYVHPHVQCSHVCTPTCTMYSLQDYTQQLYYTV